MMDFEHCIRIEKRLLPVKIHYFLFFAAIGCAFPFRTVFAKRLGISATAVGTIFCVIPFIKIVTNPLFGFVLDYFKRFRLTLSVIMIFVAFSHIAMLFIPPKAVVSHNVTNYKDQNYFSKIRYSSHNETFSHNYDPSLLMYCEYNTANNVERYQKSLTCDILCSDSTNIAASQSTGNTQHCSKKINFEIKVLIDIFNCDMDVNLKSGKMFVMSEYGQVPISENINESSVIHLKSWVVPAENCSEINSTHSDSFPKENIERAGMKLSEQSMLDEENITSFLNDRRFESTVTQENLLNGRNNRRYSALHKYGFNVRLENILINNFCRLEFTCQTINCYSKVQSDDFVSENSEVHGNEFLSSQFWGLFFLIALSSVLCSAIIFLMDAVCYEMLQEDRDKYGWSRLWGTIGWGIGAFAGGYLNQIATAESGELNYAPAFYLLAVLTFIDLIPMYNLKVTELKYSSHIWKDVCFLFTKMNIVYNVITVYLIGVLSGFIWNYQFWFMEEIGSSQILLGLSLAVESIYEVPCFIVSGFIIKKIGHDYCNSITLLFFGLRYLCFFFMYNPWWTLASALFQGPTFVLFYASMTMYAKNEAPAGTEATVQSLLHLFFEGIGVATGSFLGGVGLDKFGIRVTFLCAAVMSFTLFFINICMGIIFSIIKRRQKRISNSAAFISASNTQNS